jgi:hypothetical protein
MAKNKKIKNQYKKLTSERASERAEGIIWQKMKK